MWWWKMGGKAMQLPETRADLLRDPAVLKVAPGSAPTRGLDSRGDVVFGIETIDDALRALAAWKAQRAPQGPGRGGLP